MSSHGPAPAVLARPRFARSALASMAALAALGLTRLIHGVLVSRDTDHETYALVGSLVALTTIASLLLPAGAASAAARFIPYQQGRGDPGAARAVDLFLSRLGLAGAALLGLAAGAIAAAGYDLGMADSAQVTLLCATFCGYTVQKSTLYGYGEITAYARLELACSVVSIGLTVLVVTVGPPLYLLPLAIGYAMFGVGAWWCLRGHRRVPPTGPPDRREVWVYIGLACLGTLCASGFLQGTQLLAGRFSAPSEVAYVVAAVTLVAPAYFLPRALGLVLFPAMARAHGAGDVADVRRQADLSTRALLAVLAPLFAAAVVLAPQVLTLFGGDRYAGGAPILRLMLLATFLAVVAVAAVNALSSGSLVWVPVGSAVAGCLLGLAVVAVAGGPLGATGVALGYLLGTAVTAGGPFVTAWRLHELAWTGPLLRALAVVCGSWLVAAGLPVLDAAPIVDVLAAPLVAGLGTLVLRRDLLGLRDALRVGGTPR